MVEFVFMAPRAYWKGFLRLSLVTCPIALFPATSESEKISFNQINRNTGHRIKYQKVDADTVEEVFGHSKVRESKPGRSGSMIGNEIIAPHFGHRGLLIRSTNIAYPPSGCNDCSTLSPCRGPRTVGGGTALRKSFVRKVTDVCEVITIRVMVPNSRGARALRRRLWPLVRLAP